MGVRRTADVLEKTTWGFAIALFALCLLGTPKKQAATEASSSGTESVTRKKAEGMAPVAPLQQQMPAQQPASQTQQQPAAQQSAGATKKTP